MNERILIFEDEPAIAENLVYALKSEGFRPRRAATAQQGLELFAREKADLVILDVGLPDMDGFDVCRRIRASSPVPIFFLTARSEEVDRVVGLEIGADDYIQPFSPAGGDGADQALSGGRRHAAGRARHEQWPFVIDERAALSSSTVRRSPQPLQGSDPEGARRAPGIVFSRAQPGKGVGGPDMGLERTVDSTSRPYAPSPWLDSDTE